MTHILLPFMILPLYSVMKGDPADLPARRRLARQPRRWPRSFACTCRRPIPGIGAGALLVFILSIGYYVTPALLGGADDQMLSYYIAQYTNVNVNWGMACALGALLLAATLVLYARLPPLRQVEREPGVKTMTPRRSAELSRVRHLARQAGLVGAARRVRGRARVPAAADPGRSCRCRSATARSWSIRFPGWSLQLVPEPLHVGRVAARREEQLHRRAARHA